MSAMLRKILGPTGGWKRQAAILAGFTVVTAGLVMASDKPKLSDSKVREISVTARQLSGFDKSEPGRRKFGQLTWLGGVSLSSPSKHFGGWSGLRLAPRGRSLLTVSDSGGWLRANISYKNGKIVGLSDARLGALKALSGKRLRRNRDRDAEALTLVSGTIQRGTGLIAFERNDRVGVFPITKNGIGKPKRYLKLPKAIRKNRSSNGVESLAIVQRGRQSGAIVTFLESQPNDNGYHHGWLIKRGNAKKLWLKDIGGYAITDLASLPDGGLLVLERRFRWSEGVKMRLRHLPASKIRPGAKLKGEILLDANMSYNIDNMEGLSVHRSKAGQTIITMISDDNYNRFLQRTLLLQFAWHRPKKAKQSAAVRR